MGENDLDLVTRNISSSFFQFYHSMHYMKHPVSSYLQAVFVVVVSMRHPVDDGCVMGRAGMNTGES